jgi:oligopeptide transport system ATP-binding protein
MASQNPIVSVKDLTISFGRGSKTFDAVKNVSFDVYPGETFGIVGESGSGKTTIGRALMRLYTPKRGEILFKGKKISGHLSRSEDKALTRAIQMIFQDPMSSLNERAKVDYIVSEGLYAIGGFSEEAINQKIAQVLAEVGLPREFGSRYPHEFSGGQRQRIGIARALIMQPEFIVADEPISALDVSIRAQVLNLLKHLQKEKSLTYLFISHDLSVMRFICDRIATIHKGTLVELADGERLFTHPLHAYTRSLLSAVPEPDPASQKNKTLIAYDPNAHDYTKDLPSLRKLEEGHFVYCNDKEEDEHRKTLQMLGNK